jgi:hypothetical protein
MNTGGKVLTLLIPAGGTLQATAPGDRFYVIACPVPIQINAGDGFSPFYQGTGAYRGREFTLLQINNPANYQTVVEIWVGYTDFIDRRNIPIAPAQIGVIQTGSVRQSVPSGAPVVEIADKSETFVTNAADGLNYFLVQRLSLNLMNISFDGSNNPIPITLAAGATAGSLSGLTILKSLSALPITNPTEYPFAINCPGNFWLSWILGNTGTLNAIWFEIYQGIPLLA